jgi:hypothetical protein
MTRPPDAYWDELGVTWIAMDPDIKVISPLLEARLRSQSRWITAGLWLGLPASAVGLLLAVFTIWIGWSSGTWNFVIRGIAMGAIATIFAIGVASLLPIRAGDATRSLPEMIDLAIGRARRSLLLIRLGLFACAIAAISGGVGTAIRVHLTGPPRMSPLVDLAVLALAALVLFVGSRPIKLDLEKYKALQRALEFEGGA